MVEIPARSSMSDLLSCTGSDEVRAFILVRITTFLSAVAGILRA